MVKSPAPQRPPPEALQAAEKATRLTGSAAPSQFNDPSREWRRLFAELLGTFLGVLATVAAQMAHHAYPHDVTLAMALVTPGIATTVLIYTLGSVSGAHINPVVTLAFAVRGNFPWGRVPGYLAAQFVGAVAAEAAARLMFGPSGTFAATTPGAGVGAPLALFVEGLLTAGLVVTILATASGARNVGPNAAIAVGGYTVFAKYWAWPLTGASMNSARSLAPDLFRGDFSTTWIYFVGPVAGALLAVGVEWALKGGPTAEGSRAAQGE